MAFHFVRDANWFPNHNTYFSFALLCLWKSAMVISTQSDLGPLGTVCPLSIEKTYYSSNRWLSLSSSLGKKIDQITKKLSSSDFFYGWPFGTWFLLIHSHHVRDGDWKKILEKHVFIIKSGKAHKSMRIEKLHFDFYVLQQ